MKTEEDEAFDELGRRQGDWGGGFQAKRAMAADKLRDGKCKLCIGGCAACDARAQPAQELIYKITVIDNAHPKGIPFEDWVQPAQERKWVGLTEDELADLWYKESLDWMEFARAVIAKLQERNS